MGSTLQIGVRDVLDVVLVALFLWAAVVWLRRTRARLALVGLALVAGVYLAARRFGLELTAWMLQGFFAVFAVVVVVVFQDDLRRLFERIGTWGLRRGRSAPAAGVVDTLVRAAVRLASTRTGALIVIPGREPLDRHLEGGIALDAAVSEPLILSLFDTSSPGHDGALLLRGSRALRFAVHLPLSADHGQLGPGGTRHAAALGLAERTDALCIVVSEERGTVSIARDGSIRTLPEPERLAAEIRTFLGGDTKSAAPGWHAFAARWREGLVAVGLALGLWMLFVPGASQVEIERTAAVEIENLPEGYELESVEPAEVQVTLSGLQRDLYLEDAGALRVRIDALLVQLGRRTFQISPGQVEHPEALRVLDVEPSRIRLSVRRVDDGDGDVPTQP